MRVTILFCSPTGMAVLVVVMTIHYGCSGVKAGCTPINEHREVINAIEQHIADWKILGEELKLAPARLDGIDIDNKHNKHKLRATIRAWYHNTPESCWEDVIQALVNMDKKKLAKEIADNRGIGWELFSSTTGSKTTVEEVKQYCRNDGMKNCSLLTCLSLAIGKFTSL